MKTLIRGILLGLGVGIVLQGCFRVTAANQEVDPLPDRPIQPVQPQNPSNGITNPNAPTAVKPCPDGSIVLNTDVPFVGRCIQKSIKSDGKQVTIANVFPKLTGNLIRLVMTVIIIMGFFGILIGGFMIAADGAIGTKQQGRTLIITVIAGFILLGATGIILNLINPNFFGTASGLIRIR